MRRHLPGRGKPSDFDPIERYGAQMTLADEKYVLITTTKRNGQTVSSPVWIAPLGDGRIGFTTDLSAGKVKRVRNFPNVTLQPCNARGRVKSGTTAIPAVATVLVGDEAAPVKAAIRAKYRLMVPLVGVFYKIRGWFSKGSKDEEDCAISLVLD